MGIGAAAGTVAVAVVMRFVVVVVAAMPFDGTGLLQAGALVTDAVLGVAILLGNSGFVVGLMLAVVREA
ncbi:hypothetical protein [Microbacterium sp. 18062]|uniref:hypothetical protein n=1 Tax=Microbacterium sp. 18062 TaxID=2681410 RepID=UPI001357D251|nr:hypothetical protein [Microbacterium sp. 18062]